MAVTSWDELGCPHCSKNHVATTQRGHRRHVTMCKSNPANATEQDSVADRVRKRAEAKLMEAEAIINGLESIPDGGDVQERAATAAAAFRAYRELTALLGAA